MKIAIVGVGNGGIIVVEKISQKQNHEDIRFLRIGSPGALRRSKFDYGPNVTRYKNEKTTEVQLIPFTDTKISVAQFSSYLNNPDCNKDEILKLLSMREIGDEIYRMDQYAPCLGGRFIWF
ncbi:MAG: hypothetical protein L0Y61_09370 [Epsilonproteobacteria bacterium]|nr:hypothetical protein [Campylobacterota bacterium]